MNNEYDQFYLNLIDIWEHGGPDETEGGWAQYYYGIFSDVINKNGFKKCAEIGIGYGFHARQILDNTSVEHLYLVDPMRFYPNDGFADDVIKYGGFELLVKNINKHLQCHQDRYTWYRIPSLEITNEQIPPESLDCVFLDADHSYDAVKHDLSFWWQKLRKGGWLLGDDYQSCHPGTTRAVNEFAKEGNLKMQFYYKKEGKHNYPIYVFVKE
jgi:hypothetical protein